MFEHTTVLLFKMADIINQLAIADWLKLVIFKKS